MASEQTLQRKTEGGTAEEGGKSPAYEVTLEQALKLAQAHHRNGNLEIAERTYRDILRAVPDQFPTVQLLSAILFQRGALEEALEYGRIATEAAPENAGCWSNYAAMLSTLERYEEALDAYDQALAVDPELCEAYINKSHTLWLLKRFEEAEEAAAQATLLDPDKPEAYLNLGIAVAAQGRLKEAGKIWEDLVTLDPACGRGWANWCNALRVQGDFDKAKETGLRAVGVAPEDSDSWNNLGCVYKDLGAMEEALSAFKKATDLKPEFAEAHVNAARTLMAMDRHAEAVVAARYAIAFRKDFADAHSVMSLAFSGMGERGKARQCADMAIHFAPEESYHYLVLADIMLAGDQLDEAEAVLRKALELEPNSVDALLKLAEVQRGLDMLDEAVASIDKAIENFQETPHLFIEKARILMHAGKIEEGLEVVEKALSIAPHSPWALLTKADLLLTVNRKEDSRAVLESSRADLEEMPAFYFSLSSFKKFSKDDPDFQKLKALEERESTFGKEAQAALHYALFEAYEDIGEAGTAFAHLETAAKARGAAMGDYDAEQMRKGMENKKAMFSRETIAQYKDLGFESEIPVFIVGMPRSGTTLTEQIISSHPAVCGAGELYDLSTVIRTKGPLTFESAAVMGEAYVERIRARDKTGKALRITDKMPGNYANLGLIHCMLPHAKIIHCRRNPMDNLLSCYRQNFAVGHQWTYDQDSLAQQYAIYRDIMDYWRQVLPQGTFIEVDYEETVGNFETQARRLIEYIGLPWDDACLEPHKQKRAVLTASKDQVIQPVYQSSVEAWRRYETQLAPLYGRLKEMGFVS